jgi:hypothetical protein
MADERERGNQQECEDQIVAVNTNEGNVSESPGDGENDVSIEIIIFIVVLIVLRFIIYQNTGFLD